MNDQTTEIPPRVCVACGAKISSSGTSGSVRVGSIDFSLCQRHAEMAVGLYRVGEAGVTLVQFVRGLAALRKRP